MLELISVSLEIEIVAFSGWHIVGLQEDDMSSLSQKPEYCYKSMSYWIMDRHKEIVKKAEKCLIETIVAAR